VHSSSAVGVVEAGVAAAVSVLWCQYYSHNSTSINWVTTKQEVPVEHLLNGLPHINSMKRVLETRIQWEMILQLYK